MRTLTCPATRCRAENDATAEVCVRCQTPLRGYARLSAHAANLFDRGLAAGREGRLREARDLLAAVVHWCPTDLEARNAFALACLLQGDKDEARRSWEAVLARLPRDEVATKGMVLLQQPPGPAKKRPKGKAKANRPSGRRA